VMARGGEGGGEGRGGSNDKGKVTGLVPRLCLASDNESFAVCGDFEVETVRSARPFSTISNLNDRTVFRSQREVKIMRQAGKYSVS